MFTEISNLDFLNLKFIHAQCFSKKAGFSFSLCCPDPRLLIPEIST